MAKTRTPQQATFSRGGARASANGRRRAAVPAERTDDRYHLLVEAAPMAFVVINSDGVIELVNAQAEKLFGYRREELVGQPIETLVPPRFRTNHPRHRVGFFADPRGRMMGAGLDLAGLRKDGSEFPIEIGLNSFVVGGETRALAAVADISERKRIDAEVSGRIAAIAKSMAMVEFEMDGTIVTANDHFLRAIGYTLEEIKGGTTVCSSRQPFAKAPSTRTSGPSWPAVNITPASTNALAKAGGRCGSRGPTIRFSTSTGGRSRWSSTPRTSPPRLSCASTSRPCCRKWPIARPSWPVRRRS